MQAYFKFGNYTVYVTRSILDRVYKVNSLAPKDIKLTELSTEEDLKEKMKFSNNAWVNNLIYETLNRSYNADINKFYNEWVKFDVAGAVVQEDVLNYLDTYCRLHKNPFLVNENYTDTIEMASLIYGVTISYSRDKFYLVIPSDKNIKDKLFNKELLKEPVTKIFIDRNKVTRIVGDYNSFDMIFDNGSFITCGKEIIVTL